MAPQLEFAIRLHLLGSTMTDKAWHDCQAKACESFAEKYTIPEFAAMGALHRGIGELLQQLNTIQPLANKKLQDAWDEAERLHNDKIQQEQLLPTDGTGH